MSEKFDAKLDQLKGSAKEVIGKATGDAELESEGLVEKTIAKGKEIVEDVKDAATGAINAVKEALDKDDEVQ
ncbi:CsbD family protein [Streptococcus ovuberis]|uniref:CsbD family protein n=1 Tax=Streptococcus ovuberis TaxID=1936207 RepID=A0A7X6N054_9STRE|nr:CsbD family protein [Streptococcus ovuberis]NKZ19792.1 CsbD family protein [Streptococcus ovuberis]